MRVDAARLESGAVGELPEDEERPGARQCSTACVQEQLGPVATVEVRSAEGEVATYRLRRGTPGRNEALLPALPEHAHDALLERDTVLLQTDRLGDPQAGAVEELDERAVAQRSRGRPDCGVDQALRLGRRERAR